ncbi:MAG: Hsp70 family protein [Myxococcales bacterium]|nr:Hsp70 family protein [Myxococcales bacterium]
MTHTVVGIDLGTSYSLVATMGGEGPRIIPNSLGEALTPSAISIDDDGEVLVGAAARARAATHPERTAMSFKRDMGTARTRRLDGRDYRAEELSALVLASLKRDAEAALGAAIDEAVVTVPAYFGEAQRRATRHACDIAGLRVERIINEPTAAALAYGLHNLHKEMRAAVVDLGGGTFDVTVLEIIEGVIEIQGSSGDVTLGGDDFVEALVKRCSDQIAAEHGAPVSDALARARLWRACEVAKRRLSDLDRTTLALPQLRVGRKEIDVELELDRHACEAAWQPILDRLGRPIRIALRDAGASARDIDEVLLVGGATRIPCVQHLVATLFGRLPSRSLPPDEIVALGAAVQAALKVGDAAVEDLVVTDIAPFTLGVATAETLMAQMVSGVFTPILERGTVLPASRVKTFHTVAEGQKRLLVEVYQGEHSLCADNEKLGEYEVKGIPSGPAGEEAIDIRFTYDLNGLLEVESTVLSTRKKSTLVIEPQARRLDKKAIKRAQRDMARLKFHPRDALPNRTALARADAVYAECRGPERELLGLAIARLRTALETQEPSLIDSAREALIALTTQLAAAT